MSVSEFNIDQFVVGGLQTFVIAEIGNNHNGSYQRAIEMINLAAEIGVNSVKFQMRHLDEVYRKRTLNKTGEDLGTEYTLDLLARFELSKDDHRRLSEYCNQKNILYMCTPWDVKSVEILEEIGVLAYKVASADLTNLPLLDRLVSTGKPLIISTGMSTTEEIIITVNFLNKRNANYVLLHCNSTYPAPLHDINLRMINELLKLHSLVGYSGHERGINVSLAAVALGACVIERHFTLDRNLEGPDHAASLTFEEFKRLMIGVREIDEALGIGGVSSLTQGEMINRENLAKSLVAATPIKSGTKIAPEHIQVKSPGQGLSPQKYEELLGKILQHDMKEEDFFYPSDITNQKAESRSYTFSRPWGLPIRYHDFLEYSAIVNPDLWEFHLSYSDMELNPGEYLAGQYAAQFMVHAPELFSGSRLMDLASPDLTYRKFSISETQKVIDITRQLKQFFPNSPKPLIIANIGGFTMDEPIPPGEIESYYLRFEQSLHDLDMNGVELIPQTMAPFPWHFGGQRFQNLFVKPEEILYWCNRLKLRLCFDISHSSLTCNYFGLNFYEFSQQIAPITAHLHLGDAKGVNGEGMQIGEGDIDFKRLGKILNSECPTASFIPEIWQGHKNSGEGFWVALDRLEGLL